MIILRLSHWFAVFSTMCAPLHRHVKCTAFVPMTLRQVTLCQSLENSDCAIGPCHAKVTGQMDLNCNIANVPTQATNVNPLEQAIILCFVLKHLSYCYRSLGESYSWETDSRVVFSSCFYYCISGRRTNRLPVLANQELY